MLSVTPDRDEDQTFTAGQLAKGFGVSRETIRQWRISGKLTGRPVGREMHYSFAEVAALFRSRASKDTHR